MASGSRQLVAGGKLAAPQAVLQKLYASQDDGQRVAQLVGHAGGQAVERGLASPSRGAAPGLHTHHEDYSSWRLPGRRSRRRAGGRASNRAGSLPPAWARSGRPPPLPPTARATSWISLPAWSRGEVLGHGGDQVDLAVDRAADAHDAGAQPLAEAVGDRAQAVGVEPVDAARRSPPRR